MSDNTDQGPLTRRLAAAGLDSLSAAEQARVESEAQELTDDDLAQLLADRAHRNATH